MNEEGGHWRGRTKSTSLPPSYLSPGYERHETRLEHIQRRRQYPLLTLNEREESTLFPSSAQQPSREDVEHLKDRKIKGWRGPCWICAR